MNVFSGQQKFVDDIKWNNFVYKNVGQIRFFEIRFWLYVFFHFLELLDRINRKSEPTNIARQHYTWGTRNLRLILEPTRGLIHNRTGILMKEGWFYFASDHQFHLRLQILFELWINSFRLLCLGRFFWNEVEYFKPI